jgi:hypothetical protein
MIWKFSIKVTDGVQRLTIPRGSEILSVGDQRYIPGQIQVWVKVPPETKNDWFEELRSEERRLVVCGTGQITPAPATFLGTVLQAGDALAWHVFLEGDR